MTLTIKIDLDNAAFDDDGDVEIIRILDTLSDRLPYPLQPVSIPLRDASGNKVGEARITGERL